jgi:hypothetical protein
VGQPGCSPILIIGFIETDNPEAIRKAVLALQQEVARDPYFHSVPSIRKTAVALHAKDDTPEVRYLFFKALEALPFDAQFVVARKIERVFRNDFQARESEFYDHLMSALFQNVLHRREHNHIYFAKRGSRSRQAPLYEAVKRGVVRCEETWKTKVTASYDVQAQVPSGEPCLSVIDYLNWSVYRAFTTGEMRYYKSVEDKVNLLVDLYDTASYPGSWYSRRNPFDTKKITPL